MIGVPDRTWGEAVRPSSSCGDDGSDVASPTSSSPTAATRLAGYKVPKQIRFVDGELPRTPTGKLLRRDLRRTWPSDGG